MKFILDEKTKQWVCVIPFSKDKMPFLVEFPDDQFSNDGLAFMAHRSTLSSGELNTTYPPIGQEKNFLCVANYKENNIVITTDPKILTIGPPEPQERKKEACLFILIF